jgi:hypothetical protein
MYFTCRYDRRRRKDLVPSPNLRLKVSSKAEGSNGKRSRYIKSVRTDSKRAVFSLLLHHQLNEVEVVSNLEFGARH